MTASKLSGPTRVGVVRRSLSRVAALALAAAGVVAVPVLASSPAAAAACTGDTGVTVVVDYNQLGGLEVGCASGAGGKQASQAFTEAGFDISYVRNDAGAGFVCRVAGLPTGSVCGSTPPTTAYWGLWWSNGDGNWTYATRGVSSLKVPDGSFVAFSWHEGSGRAEAPDVQPRRSTPEPVPTTQPSPQPSEKPTRKPDRKAPSRTGEVKPEPTEEPTAAESTVPGAAEEEPSEVEPGKRKGKRAKQDDAAEVEPTEATTPDADLPTVDEITDGPPESGTRAEADGGADDGLPVWVPIAAVLLVAAAGGAVVVRRRLG